MHAQIKPVYYWPGERVDLPCQMCSREHAFNGRMKYWSVIRAGFFSKIDFLSRIPRKAWTLLDEGSVKEFRNNDNERVMHMPSFDPRGGTFSIRDRLHDRKSFYNNLRPKMTYVQRDGRLKILTVIFSVLFFWLRFVLAPELRFSIFLFFFLRNPNKKSNSLDKIGL